MSMSIRKALHALENLLMGRAVDYGRADYHCDRCGGVSIQISYPAWHNPNKGFDVIESDLEAEPLSIWCPDCDDHVGVICKEFGDPQTWHGRHD